MNWLQMSHPRALCLFAVSFALAFALPNVPFVLIAMTVAGMYLAADLAARARRREQLGRATQAKAVEAAARAEAALPRYTSDAEAVAAGEAEGERQWHLQAARDGAACGCTGLCKYAPVPEPVPVVQRLPTGELLAAIESGTSVYASTRRAELLAEAGRRGIASYSMRDERGNVTYRGITRSGRSTPPVRVVSSHYSTIRRDGTWALNCHLCGSWHPGALDGEGQLTTVGWNAIHEHHTDGMCTLPGCDWMVTNSEPPGTTVARHVETLRARAELLMNTGAPRREVDQAMRDYVRAAKRTGSPMMVLPPGVQVAHLDHRPVARWRCAAGHPMPFGTTGYTGPMHPCGCPIDPSHPDWRPGGTATEREAAGRLMAELAAALDEHRINHDQWRAAVEQLTDELDGHPPPPRSQLGMRGLP